MPTKITGTDGESGGTLKLYRSLSRPLCLLRWRTDPSTRLQSANIPALRLSCALQEFGYREREA